MAASTASLQQRLVSTYRYKLSEKLGLDPVSRPSPGEVLAQGKFRGQAGRNRPIIIYRTHSDGSFLRSMFEGFPFIRAVCATGPTTLPFSCLTYRINYRPLIQHQYAYALKNFPEILGLVFYLCAIRGSNN